MDALVNINNLCSPTAINSEPNFENQGEWSAGYMLAKHNGQGVKVGPGDDNPNVFIQSFDVNSKKYFRLVVRARRASGQSGKAKLQVNWLAENGQFIQVTQKYFEVNNQEITTVEHRLKVPNGAATGVIYVVPGSKDHQVQYYEMSLYPDEGLKPVANVMLSTDSAAKGYFATAGRGMKWLENMIGNKRNDTVRPKDFWKNFGKCRPVCFIHIPKTAGHSVYSLLERNYPADDIVVPYSGVEGNIHEILNLTLEEVKRTKIIAAHMPLGVHQYIGECDYLTFLRDPIDLVLSGYYFNMENPGAPTYKAEVGLNRSLLQYAECNDNMMTRYLINSAFSSATFWLSGEVNPGVKGVSYIGLDCMAKITVRSVALQQWNFNYCPTRFPAPGTVQKVAIECSNDNFMLDVRLVAEIQLEDDRELHSYQIPCIAQGRFWRLRALSSPRTARWGVVALKFFEQEANSLPPLDYGHIAIPGKPLCSSAVDNYPAANAFDGRDRLALHQLPPNALSMCHLEEAIKNIREKCLIGLVEKYDQSINMMAKVLNWTCLAYEKKNAGQMPRDASILSNYEKKQLMEINHYDVLLYKYAQRLFQSDLKNFQN